jgi:hypothetical protein
MIAPGDLSAVGVTFSCDQRSATPPMPACDEYVAWPVAIGGYEDQCTGLWFQTPCDRTHVLGGCSFVAMQDPLITAVHWIYPGGAQADAAAVKAWCTMNGWSWVAP